MHRDLLLNAFWVVGGIAAVIAPWAIGSLPDKPSPHDSIQRITRAPAGPFRVEGNQIVDASGQPFLIRGTELAPFNPRTIDYDNRAELDYGAHSATTFSAIRLRYNFNAVRLPLDVRDASEASYFDRLSEVVRRANGVELLVILAPREDATDEEAKAFWADCATYFRDYPNVLFEALPAASPAADLDAHSDEGWQAWKAAIAESVRTIRSAGAQQPIVVNSWKDASLFAGLSTAALLDDPSIVYQAAPRYVSTHNDADRDIQFGFLAEQVPVLATGWDLELDDPEACGAIPQEPSAAAHLVQDNLDYFDREGISWTVSQFTPGKLVKDFSEHDGTRIDYGWNCGETSPLGPAGIGRMIQAHMRSVDEKGLSVVSGSGGMALGRGAFAIAYGPIMAEKDAHASGLDSPRSLGRIAVQVTDSKGVSRLAQMMWAGAGWGQANFAIPEDSAVGPAKLEMIREDGSRLSTNITIADTAPGFFTNYSCRGAALGSVVQVFGDGASRTSRLETCSGPYCRAAPIPLSEDAKTIVRFEASGIRHATSVDDFNLTIAGRPVPVLSFEADAEGLPGRDFLTVEIPSELRGLGETDMICWVGGRMSNVVRVQLGS